MKAKKTIAGVLAFSMLVTAAASMQVSAADATVTLKASHETVEKVGDAFSVDVSIADVPSTKVNTLDFALTYDASMLTVTDVTLGDAANTDVSGDTTGAEAPIFSYSLHEGEITVSWTTALGSDAWIAEDGVILTISGTVNEDAVVAPGGTVTEIDFAPVARESYEGSGVANSRLVVGAINGTDRNVYEVNTEAGSVTIGKSAETTEPVVTTESVETTTELIETTTKPVETEEVDVTDVTTTKKDDVVGTLCGDVNLDGDVGMADVIALNKAAVNIMDLTPVGEKNGDCNADGALNGNDALILLKFQVGLIKELPYTGEAE